MLEVWQDQDKSVVSKISATAAVQDVLDSLECIPHNLNNIPCTVLNLGVLMLAIDNTVSFLRQRMLPVLTQVTRITDSGKLLSEAESHRSWCSRLLLEAYHITMCNLHERA